MKYMYFCKKKCLTLIMQCFVTSNLCSNKVDNILALVSKCFIALVYSTPFLVFFPKKSLEFVTDL